MKTKFAMAAFCLLLLAGIANAQTISGVVSGRVVDTTGAVIPGAGVTLISQATGTQRETVSSETGDFVFAAVLPGRYTVRVELPGMKRLEKTSINITASERLAIGDLVLEIGALTETVEVTAVGTPVQTESADRSSLLTPDQLQALATKTRDYISLLQALPGVILDPPALFGTKDILGITEGPKISGLRQELSSFMVDGVAMNNLNSRGWSYGPITMDAIAEVKVQQNNYPAEYGRGGGAIVNVVVKSGTQQFHGTGYTYIRNEALNANEFFNNRNGVPRPIYRYITGGGTIGGPIYWPGKFNSERSKLFFFVSNETLRGKTPLALVQVTTPTALEKAGDFSQSFDVNGRLIVVRDPLTGAAFSNNVIPANRINSNGQKLLNLFPSPNQLNRSLTGGTYNYNFQETDPSQKQGWTFRVDANITQNVRMYVRGTTWRESNQGYNLGGGQLRPAWGNLRVNSQYWDNEGTFNLVYVIKPTLVHEFSVAAHNPNDSAPPVSWSEVPTRTGLGLKLPQFYPATNPNDLVPFTSFGGILNAAGWALDGRFPKRTNEAVVSINDSLSWIHGPHNYKFGLYIERWRGGAPPIANFPGIFNFASDANDPNNSGYAYANALLGNFTSYSEISSRYIQWTHGQGTEWYAQDHWKVSPRLSFDYGLRMGVFMPDYYVDGRAAYFDPAKYDLSQSVTLYRPALSQGRRVAVNPLTGQFAPAAYIGALVPDSGKITNGTVLQGNAGYPRAFVKTRGVQWGPRFGFAYDPFGDGKTAIRGAAGIMYNNKPGGGGSSGNPPTRLTPFLYYGNLNDYLSSAPVLFPSSTSSADPENKIPAVYHLSFGIQRSIGAQTTLDVSYVGTLARHLRMTEDINTVPYGTRFVNRDPTSSAALPDSFLVPYVGYNQIIYRENAGTSNYHSLVVQANRRFSKGLQFGGSWVWSRALDFGSSDDARWARYTPHRVWNYGPADFDRTHQVTFNWSWDIPKASKLWNNGLTRAAFDDWRVSGISSFVSGRPYSVTLSTVQNIDLVGGGDGARPLLTCDPSIPRGDRTLNRFFNPNCFALPAVGIPGNASRNVARGPGINNWDISLAREFRVGERARLRFQWETYNTFNHTQFYEVNTAARFDAVTGSQVNSLLGSAISSRDSRRMQGSLRLSF
jgi:hypothetical protein